MMKKIFSVALMLCIILSAFCGCGKKKDDKTVSSAPVSSVVSQAATPEPAKNAKAVKINADGGLNIRSKPSTDGEIVAVAENGSKLPLLIEKASDGWYEVEYNGESAYVSAEYAIVVEVTLDEYNKLKAGDFSTGGEEESSTAGDDPTDSKATASPAPSTSSQPDTSTVSNATVGNEDGE